MRFSSRLSVVTTCLIATHLLTITPCAHAEPTTNEQTQPAIEEQTSAALASPVPSLLIPVLPGARLRVEINASDGDILGVLKSFLEGIDTRSLTAIGAFPAMRLTSASLAPDEANNATELMPVSPPHLLAPLSQGDLKSLLQNIKHLHLVVYEQPMPRMVSSPAFTMTPAAPTGKSAANPGAGGKPSGSTQAASPQKSVPSPPQAAVPQVSPARFYESAFINEKGKRIVWADFDQIQLTMLGFSETGGFAAVLQGPGMVGVLRTDGYPDLHGVGPVMMLLASRFMPR
jgi:hypothetical protein